MFAGSLRLIYEATILFDLDLDQIEFERALDWRKQVRNALWICRRYRKFYDARCDLKNLYEITSDAAANLQNYALLYIGDDPIKSGMLFRWLRKEAVWHDLEACWLPSGIILVRW